MQRIGFIGASGLMGHGMAKHLRAKGFPLALTACWLALPQKSARAC